jgi:hypothetical protein
MDADSWKVFEDEALADKAVVAVEKTIHHEGNHGIGEPGIELGHVKVEAVSKQA